MREKELLPGIYKAREETYCLICVIEGKRHNFGKSIFASISELYQYKQSQFLKETMLICSCGKLNIVRKYGGQVCIPALLPM